MKVTKLIIGATMVILGAFAIDWTITSGIGLFFVFVGWEIFKDK